MPIQIKAVPCLQPTVMEKQTVISKVLDFGDKAAKRVFADHVFLDLDQQIGAVPGDGVGGAADDSGLGTFDVDLDQTDIRELESIQRARLDLVATQGAGVRTVAGRWRDRSALRQFTAIGTPGHLKRDLTRAIG